MTAFGAPAGAAGLGDQCTARLAELAGGRLTISLSPAPSRGFSGEGHWLQVLAENDSRKSVDRASKAAAGQLGFDVAKAEWFPRHLPFSGAALEEPGGRLAAAKRLVAEGAVSYSSAEGSSIVVSGKNQYQVSKGREGFVCTCPWWGKHQTSRGPCKHILATLVTVVSS